MLYQTKLVNKTTSRPHIEIRFDKDNQDILVMVSLVGEMKLRFGSRPTEMCNIRVSSKLPIRLSFQEWEELNTKISEAVQTLSNLIEDNHDG